MSACFFRPHRFPPMLAALLSLCQGPLFAHDMWIEPFTFSPTIGQIVGVRLRVGQNLLGDPLPRDPALIKEFVMQDSLGRKPVIGHDGADPAGLFRVTSSDLLIVGYNSNASAVELTADKFNKYLDDEGLDAVASLRASRKETGATARELFSRCAKSLLLSGVPNAAQHDRALGFPLELVAERNPFLLSAGEELPFRLTYENRPLSGALVVAISRLAPMERVAVRTDKDGRARFRLHSGGMWLIKAVHMIPAPSGSSAQWQSFWASVTFERPNERLRTN